MNSNQKKLLFVAVIQTLKTFDITHDEYLEKKAEMHDYIFGAKSAPCGYTRADKQCGITQGKCPHWARQEGCSKYYVAKEQT